MTIKEETDPDVWYALNVLMEGDDTGHEAAFLIQEIENEDGSDRLKDIAKALVAILDPLV